jgi:predicted Rossmann fold flavoprotein
MLRAEMDRAGADLWLQASIDDVSHRDGQFHVALTREGRRHQVTADHLVLATGGKSIPKMGATGLAYRIAESFGHRITETRPALVPLTFDEAQKAVFAGLAGTAVEARVACHGATFDEAVLFTHRGLSGPAILQISSYWREGDRIALHLRPDLDLYDHLRARRAEAGARAVPTVLAELLPKALARHLSEAWGLTGNLADQSDAALRTLADRLEGWTLAPTSSEGYRTAEVTLGGVAIDRISSKTMESQIVSRLYVIGEALDVTGWLGGYNFQWAWASGVAAGRAIAAR